MTAGLLGSEQALAVIPCPAAVPVNVSLNSPARNTQFGFRLSASNLSSIPAGTQLPKRVTATGQFPSTIVAREVIASTGLLECEVKRGSANPVIEFEAPFPAYATSCTNASQPNTFSCTGASGTGTLSCSELLLFPDAAGDFVPLGALTTSNPRVLTNAFVKSVNSTTKKLTCKFQVVPTGGILVAKRRPNDGKTYVAQGSKFFTTEELGGGTVTVEAENMNKSTGGSTSGGWNLWSNGTLSKTVTLSPQRVYQINVLAKATLANGVGADMTVKFGSGTIGTKTVTNTGSYASYTFFFRTPAEATQNFVISFTNDLNANGQDRNLLVDKVIFTPQ